MQDINWDDLRFLIALSRSHSLAEAATLLGVNGTTVSRRLKTFEQQVGSPLIQSVGGHHYRLSDLGLELLQVAERTQRELLTLQEQANNADNAVKGRIVLTAAPVLCNRLLLPALRPFVAAHPQLDLQLLAENKNIDLISAEIDMAIRLSKPTSGGRQLITKRLGTLDHAVYVQAGSDHQDFQHIPWVLYVDGRQHLPQLTWMSARAKNEANNISGMRVTDLESAIEAVANGYGRSAIPCLMGDADPRLTRLPPQAGIELLKREVWALWRSDRTHLSRLRALLDAVSLLFDARSDRDH